MSDLKLAEVMAEKKKMEDSITKVVQDFTTKTGMGVANLQLEQMYTQEGRIIINGVRAEVRL